MNQRPLLPALLALAALALPGCRSTGPRSIVADRVAYNEAIATSWKEQTLLNIVKVRYLDPPFFVDLAQIVGGYTMQKSASTNLQIAPPFFPNALDLAVESINGVRNRSTAGGEVSAGNPEFRRVLQVIRQAQRAGTVNMRIELDKEKKESVLLIVRDKGIDPALAAELKEMRKLLGLDPEQSEFHVVFGSVSRRPNEIALLTRSVARILSDLASFVDVPVDHSAEGRARPVVQSLVTEDSPLHVSSGCKKPEDSFAAVCYRGHWFWVDDRDLNSKLTFNFLLALLALSDTAAKEALPLVTIQAN